MCIRDSNTGTIGILDHTDHGGHNHILLDSNINTRPSQQIVEVDARTIDSYNFDDVDIDKLFPPMRTVFNKQSAKERAKLRALEKVTGQIISSEELEKCSEVDGKSNCERNQFFLSSFNGEISEIEEDKEFN